MDIPEPRYATASDGIQIAYQVFGRGRHDLVYLPGNASQLDVSWESPAHADFFRRLADVGRVICIDRRGVGLSDRVGLEDLPPAEVNVSDLLSVLDTVGSRGAIIIGLDEGAQTAVLFAATHPERVRKLVLFGARPSMVATERHPWGGSREEWEAWLVWAADHWGSREAIVSDFQEFAPSQLDDEAALIWGAKVSRAAASPRAAVALFRISLDLDVADVLPVVPAPTLILNRRGDRLSPPEAGRAVAELMSDATFVELPGEDHFPEVGPKDELFEALARFVGAGAPSQDGSRRLATVLFTDIVDGTARAAEIGDRAWRALIADHHRLVREALTEYRGVEVDTAGDGFFATFDGPARAVRCAHAIASAVEGLGIRIRAGVHTGEVEAMDGKVGGIAVIIGARISALAGPSEVLVSATVRDLVAGSGLSFDDVGGERDLKGVPGRWRVYRLADS
jgi:pimeloyl-ACP methyl ester carboxylesterase